MHEATAVGGATAVVRCHFHPDGRGAGLRQAIEKVCEEVDRLLEAGVWAIVLSDRDLGPDRVAIPSLLITAAVHHHLVQTRNRTRVGLIVETGDAREVHHLCLLLGYGATAVNPYMAFAAIDHMIEGRSHGLGGVDRGKAHANYMKAAGKGILKVMSKMGIATVVSYIGAQIFEAVGVGPEVIDPYFTGTVSRIGGVGLDIIAAEAVHRHRVAFAENPGEIAHRDLDGGGEYQWRREGEHHLFNPETVYKLQHSTRAGRYDIFNEYTRLVDEQSERLGTPPGPAPLQDGGENHDTYRGGRTGIGGS